MKNFIRIFGIIALAAVIGVAKTASDDGFGGGIPAALVAVWYFDFNNNGEIDGIEDIISAYEFKSNGKVEVLGMIEYNFSVRGGRIQLNGADDWATFNITGNRLTITNSGTSGFNDGDYVKE